MSERLQLTSNQKKVINKVAEFCGERATKRALVELEKDEEWLLTLATGLTFLVNQRLNSQTLPEVDRLTDLIAQHFTEPDLSFVYFERLGQFRDSLAKKLGPKFIEAKTY